MRTMASQRDKSADLFALTARSRNCLSSSCEPASAAHLLQVQKQKTAEEHDRPSGQNRCAGSCRGACFVFPWQRSEALKFAATPPMALQVSRTNPRSTNFKFNPSSNRAPKISAARLHERRNLQMKRFRVPFLRRFLKNQRGQSAVL